MACFSKYFAKRPENYQQYDKPNKINKHIIHTLLQVTLFDLEVGKELVLL